MLLIFQLLSVTVNKSFFSLNSYTVSLKPLVHSITFLGLYKKLDVKKPPFNIEMKKMSHFSHQRSLASEITTFYVENKTRALTG